MIRLLSDENLDGTLVRGLLRRLPDIDLLQVQDVGLRQTDDPAILAWAAAEGRILLTHDRNTIPGFAFDRVRRHEPHGSQILRRRRHDEFHPLRALRDRLPRMPVHVARGLPLLPRADRRGDARMPGNGCAETRRAYARFRGAATDHHHVPCRS